MSATEPGAGYFVSGRTRLFGYVECTSYGVILIIIPFVVASVLVKTWSCLQPSHGNLLSSFLHCKMLDAVYNKGMLGPAASPGSGLGSPMRAFSPLLHSANMLGPSALTEARVSAFLC